MSSPGDLKLYDRHDRLVGLVDVRAKLGTTAEWARLTRRNLLAHRDYPEDTFFLIVTPDRLYLWDSAKGSSPHTPPDIVLDAEPVFGPYFEASRIDPAKASPSRWWSGRGSATSCGRRKRGWTTVPSQGPV